VAPLDVAVRGRTWRAAAVAALALTIAAVAPTAATAAAGAHADPKGDAKGPLDIAGVRFQQTGTDAILTLRMAAPVGRDELPGSGRGTLCATFSWGTPVAPRKRFCVVGSNGKPLVNADTLDPKSGKITARSRQRTVTQDGAVFTLKYTASKSGLPVGLVHLAVRSTWHVGSACDDTRDGCVDQAPTSGTYPVRVYRAIPAGCQPSSGQVTNGPRGSKVVALTFDDGPSGYTPAFLSILRSEGVHATFFQIGQQVGGQSTIEKAILDQGSALADHSWSHPDLSRGGAFARDQLSRTKSAITSASGGYVPCLYRPPYGATSSALVSVGDSLGMKSVLWDVDTNDWQLPGTSAIVSRVLNGVRPGSIVLMHDGGGNRSQGQAALRPIIRGLKERGYRFATVPELLGLKTRYTLSRT
jgi:peptidoglycan-N-acetylglucosamine deacetylase